MDRQRKLGRSRPTVAPRRTPVGEWFRTASDDRQSSGAPSTVIRTSPLASLAPDHHRPAACHGPEACSKSTRSPLEGHGIAQSGSFRIVSKGESPRHGPVRG